MCNPALLANSRLDSDTMTVSSEDASYPKANLYDDRPFIVFKPASVAASVDIITDAGMGNTADVDYLVVYGHDLFTRSASLAFAWSTDGITYTDIIAATAATDNKIICRMFTLVQKRFFRLRISGATGVFSIGQAQWGKACQYPFGLEWQGFDPLEEKTQNRMSRSQAGQILGAVALYSERSADIKLKFAPESFVRSEVVGNFGEFWKNFGSQKKPFVFAWNPGNPGSYEKDAFWCVADNDPKRPLATPVSGGYYDLSFSVAGVKE